MDGITVLAVVFMGAIAINSVFDLCWSAFHSRHEPLSADDRKRIWKAAFTALLGIAVVLAAHGGVLTALGLLSKLPPGAKLPVDALATAIIIAAGADKFSQFASFISAHEPPAAPTQSVHLVTTDQVSYSLSGEMTVLNE